MILPIVAIKRERTTTIRNIQNKKKYPKRRTKNRMWKRRIFFKRRMLYTDAVRNRAYDAHTMYICLFYGEKCIEYVLQWENCLLTCIHQLTCYIDRWLLRPEFDRNVMLWCFDDDDGPMEHSARQMKDKIMTVKKSESKMLDNSWRHFSVTKWFPSDRYFFVVLFWMAILLSLKWRILLVITHITEAKMKQKNSRMKKIVQSY